MGLPAKFARWRPGQADAVWAALDPKERAVGMRMPTGTGKTAAYAAACMISGYRTMILTATLQQQKQVYDDFESIGLKSVKGQSNYFCNYDPFTRIGKTTVNEGPCQIGIKCDLKDGGCDYYDAVREAKASVLMGGMGAVSNYSYWMHSAMYSSEDVFKPEVLILDEAHQAPEQVCNALAIKLDASFVVHRYIEDFPRGEDPHVWAAWFVRNVGKVHDKREELSQLAASKPTNALLKVIARLRSLERRLQRGTLVEQDPWVMRRDDTNGNVEWQPLWPARYSRLLFQQVDRTVLVSATLQPKTFELLGLRRFKIYDCPHPFPISARTIYVPSGVRIQGSSTDADLDQWVALIDRIIEGRTDRKGLIPCVSYERGVYLKDHSRYGGFMRLHDRREAQSAVEAFRRDGPPSILVSPAVSTGVDFPNDDCRYIIIAKVPFPPKGDPIVQARCESDPDYMGYSTALETVQMAGRGVRTDGDWCETFIVDANFGWFYNRNSRHFPVWFKQAVRHVGDSIPVPPPLLWDPRVDV